MAALCNPSSQKVKREDWVYSQNGLHGETQSGCKPMPQKWIWKEIHFWTVHSSTLPAHNGDILEILHKKRWVLDFKGNKLTSSKDNDKPTRGHRSHEPAPRYPPGLSSQSVPLPVPVGCSIRCTSPIKSRHPHIHLHHAALCAQMTTTGGGCLQPGDRGLTIPADTKCHGTPVLSDTQ